MLLPTPFIVATALVVLVLTWVLFKRAFRAWAMHRYTVVPDLARAGAARTVARVPGAAVVCGGSIAGLFTARVCADHFQRVVVVEPEAWTFTDAARAPPVDTHKETAGYKTMVHQRTRVHQYTALHAYQALLLRAMRKLFPRFDDVAREWGVIIAPCDPYAMFDGNLWSAPWAEYGNALPDTIGCSRRMFEPLLRKLVASACLNVEYVHGTVVEYLLGYDRTIRAVVVRNAEGATYELECTLVADCTGVTQAGLKLLSRALPQQLPLGLREQYNPQMNYTSLDFPCPPGFDDFLRTLNISRTDGGAIAIERTTPLFMYFPDPAREYRSIAILRRENGGVVLSGGGWASEMPETLSELREYVDKLHFRARIPAHVFAILDVLQSVEHTAALAEARITSCSRINYPRAAGVLPRNFVAIGDCSMRLNPRFGEGVTKAMLGTITLDGVLRRWPPSAADFGATFFARLAARTNFIWDRAKDTDYGHATTTPVPGEALSHGAFARWFVRHLNPVVVKDARASWAAWHLANFLAPPLDIFAPSIVLAIVRDAIWSTSS